MKRIRTYRILIVWGLLSAALAFGYASYCINKKGEFLPIFLSSGSGGAVVTTSAIPGITVPVRGALASTTPIETDQFTGTVTWSPNDTLFAPKTVYSAFIVLVPKAGYTFEGVPANFFTVPGSTTTNDADSGAVVARFPETGAASDIEVSFTGATQTGGVSGTADSTGLALTFDKDPVTLTADNIYLTGATKGVLSGSGNTRHIAISNLTVLNGDLRSQLRSQARAGMRSQDHRRPRLYIESRFP